MTLANEDLRRALREAAARRVPEMSAGEAHVFSPRFEEKMRRLIKREQKHPWAVRRNPRRVLFAAAVAVLLLFALGVSVGAAREKLTPFFLRHFSDHDDVILEGEGKKHIEEVYAPTAIPEGFEKTMDTRGIGTVVFAYENTAGDYVAFKQSIPSDQGDSVDNEHFSFREFMFNGQAFFAGSIEDMVNLIWEHDGYVFTLTVAWPGATLDDALEIWSSIRLLPD